MEQILTYDLEMYIRNQDLKFLQGCNLINS